VNRRVAEVILRKAGFEITCVADGSEAVEAARSGAYDLILMDVQMPRMDGIEATAALRDAGIALPIIALTAHALEGDAERFRGAGMDDYISKPFEPGRLVDVVSSWIVKGSAPRAETIPPPPGGDGDDVRALDIEDGLHRVLYDRETYREVLGVFLTQGDDRLAALRRSVEKEDLAEARGAAHALKSAAGSIGARAAQELARAIEEGAARGDGEAARTGVAHLAAELSRVRRCACAWLAGEAGGRIASPAAQPSDPS